MPQTAPLFISVMPVWWNTGSGTPRVIRKRCVSNRNSTAIVGTFEEEGGFLSKSEMEVANNNWNLILNDKAPIYLLMKKAASATAAVAAAAALVSGNIGNVFD